MVDHVFAPASARKLREIRINERSFQPLTPL
jgi:hypothetical protein